MLSILHSVVTNQEHYLSHEGNSIFLLLKIIICSYGEYAILTILINVIYLVLML